MGTLAVGSTIELKIEDLSEWPTKHFMIRNLTVGSNFYIFSNETTFEISLNDAYWIKFKDDFKGRTFKVYIRNKDKLKGKFIFMYQLFDI